MQTEVTTSQLHRTDAKRGPRVQACDKQGRRVAGVYVRAGKFIVQYTDIEGRVRFKTTAARNLTQARAEREKLRVDVRSGQAVVPSKVTLADVARDFLSTFDSYVVAGEKSERTLELYRQRWRTHLERPLGRLHVQAIRPEHIARVLESLRRAGLSSWTVRGVYVLLGSILQHAMTRGLISESPLKRLAKSERPQGRPRSQPRTLTDDECARLIASAAPGWRTMIAVAASTGLRLSELHGLRWDAINFAEGLIHVRFQLSRGTAKKPARLVPLKTGAGERDVYLLPELASLLKRAKAEALAQGRARPESFVFCTREGGPRRQRNAYVALQAAAKRAGLNSGGGEPLGWHDLRHTAISRLIAAGLDVVEVQRQAGHARPSITLDLYSHEFQRAKRSDDIRAKIAASGVGSILAP